MTSSELQCLVYVVHF